MSILEGLIRLLLSLFKEEGEEQGSSCTKISISLFAYIIKSKFDDDNFITSKYV